MSDLPTPVTREERYLNGIAQGDTSNLPTPVGREEKYLDYIARNGGGGGGGTTNYNALENKPQIAGTTLQGNKSLADLGIAGEDAIEDVYAVMGEMGAKNLIPYPYRHASGRNNRGVIFTYGSDGIIYMNGTSDASSQPFLILVYPPLTVQLKASKSYILYCDSDNEYVFSAIFFKNSDLTDKTVTFNYEYNTGEKGSATQSYVSLYNDNTNTVYRWVKFTLSDDVDYNQIDIRVVAGSHQVNNAYGKVMLIDGRDTDLTWKIFAKTNKQLTDEIANKVDKEAGKGLSTNDYDDTEKGKVSANAEAIEAMVNVNGAKNWALLEPESESKDGITFTCTDGKSLTLSGTASDNTGKSYNLATPITGDVIVTLEQTANKVTLSYNDGTDWHPLPADGKVNGTIVQVGFNMVSGTVINETVYLMIRDARITDPTYVPYAMTNAELTDAVNKGSVSVTGNGVKTYGDLFNELFSLIDRTKINRYTILQYSESGYNFPLKISLYTNSEMKFIAPTDGSLSNVYLSVWKVKSTASEKIEVLIESSGVTFIDNTAQIPTGTLTLYY